MSINKTDKFLMKINLTVAIGGDTFKHLKARRIFSTIDAAYAAAHDAQVDLHQKMIDKIDTPVSLYGLEFRPIDVINAKFSVARAWVHEVEHYGYLNTSGEPTDTMPTCGIAACTLDDDEDEDPDD